MNKNTYTPEVLQHFAKAVNARIRHNRVDIPPAYGNGYCIGFAFNRDIRMLILNYTLKQPINLISPDNDIHSKMILFKFQYVLPDVERNAAQAPCVLIATRKVQANVIMPVHSHTATINIEIDAAYLSSLLPPKNQSVIVSQLLKNDQPLLFEQTAYPSMLQIVHEIIHEPVKEPFRLFFLRIKAEELVCRLLIALENRQEKQLLPLHPDDIQTLYIIREKILQHPQTPPALSQLADIANMSSSKLKILFRQIFGTSIYRYYQQFRMQEAARLLSEGQRSVSEVGYHLGFSNLSHFSRVFEQHIGIKPKRFSLQRSKNKI